MVIAKYILFLMSLLVLTYTVLTANTKNQVTDNDNDEDKYERQPRKKQGLLNLRRDRRYEGYILHFYYERGQKRGKTTCTPREKQSLRQLKLLDSLLFNACQRSELDHIVECEVGSKGTTPNCNDWRGICTEELGGNVGYDDCKYLS